MQILRWNTLSSLEQNECLKRPAMANNAAIAESVKNIIQSIQTTGDRALRQFTETFDQTKLEQIALSDADIDAACARLNDETRAAIDQAYTNISSFHQAQIPQPLAVETLSGVVCEMISRPINRVGLYIPGGTAPLPSTVLMLGVPSQIAGCKAVVLCSPPPIADEILYAAKKCGIESIYQIGGAQAVAAMAYGTETVTKVDKIFGPGNAFVTEAKRQVSADHQGAAIDMPAGPSEVLVIADAAANPEFIAADLLSQAEHGADSQVMLVTPSSTLANHVQTALTHQLSQLSRAETAAKALSESRIIIAETIEQCVEISNQYAPEHLIVHTENPRDLLPDLDNAGSIFLGEWSPESVGDYASGTNHVLPTYGFTRTYSSLGLADFSKRMTVQTLSPSGLKALAPTVITLANAEGLDAHRNAVTIRLQSMDTQ